MRTFIDSILTFINSWSLSDDELNALTIEDQVYTIETYNAVKAILEAREATSVILDRLKLYFTAKGIEVSTPAKTAQSQMYIGDVL